MFKLGFLFSPLFTSRQDPPPDPAPHPNAPSGRVRRVRVTMSNYPALVLEATPSGALDVQQLAGVKRVEPDPRASEPDHCGSNYYTVMVSTLYDFRAVVQSIEDLNDLALPPVFLEGEP